MNGARQQDLTVVVGQFVPVAKFVVVVSLLWWASLLTPKALANSSPRLLQPWVKYNHAFEL